MVKPMHRSRSYRRIYRRTPGGRSVTHYERRKNTPMRCARCGNILAGVPIKDNERRSLSKSLKRPERIFGGVLCPRCLRVVLKRVVREELTYLSKSLQNIVQQAEVQGTPSTPTLQASS